MNKIDYLKENSNVAGLVTVLRRADAPPELRAQAAAALGELQEIETTESLVRAMLEDPAQLVQDAAHRALVELHGDQLKLIISSYRGALPYDDPWLKQRVKEVDAASEPEHGFEDSFDSEENGEEVIEDPLNEIDFGGLIAILQGDSPAEMRIKAVRLLPYSTDARAVEWLLMTALDDDEEQVRDAARQTLQEMFPEDADQMLQDFNSEAEEDKDWVDVDEGYQTGASRSQTLLESQPPAIMQEKDRLPLVIIAVVLVAAVVILLLLLIGR